MQSSIFIKRRYASAVNAVTKTHQCVRPSVRPSHLKSQFCSIVRVFGVPFVMTGLEFHQDIWPQKSYGVPRLSYNVVCVIVLSCGGRCNETASVGNDASHEVRQGVPSLSLSRRRSPFHTLYL